MARAKKRLRRGKSGPCRGCSLTGNGQRGPETPGPAPSEPGDEGGPWSRDSGVLGAHSPGTGRPDSCFFYCRGRERTRTAYLVEWEDGSEPTWEPLSHVTAALVDAYENSIDSADDQAGFEDELDELEDAEWAAEEARKAKEQRYKEKMKQATY